jgi:hypothetical protein
MFHGSKILVEPVGGRNAEFQPMSDGKTIVITGVTR